MVAALSVRHCKGSSSRRDTAASGRSTHRLRPGPPPHFGANETFGPGSAWPEFVRATPPAKTGGLLARWWKVAVVIAIAVPALALRILGVYPAPLVGMLVFGPAVVASAFLLVWAAEAAQRDISGSLATAILAVIAVLPEYAVDLYFAWSAGHIPQNAHYAAANMTGSNRLLLGLGWPFVVLLFVLGARRRGQRATGIVLREGRRVELGFLGAASIYSLVVPFTRRIAWYDSVVLLGIFF